MGALVPRTVLFLCVVHMLLDLYVRGSFGWCCDMWMLLLGLCDTADAIRVRMWELRVRVT